ncbi:PepSY domain-containing protein [Neisseria montereyensis]|uniref:PepSY domain-containing protein n=1 Tax=Neisseria montereyensis TaxID=2973938 RepID=A0ABT2F963_9NEIS|nr:PepSY domain-containing protein [Neisseria montereyensis]MCS4532730.1 PepSY domain-containing protein [Neisseria montereyensis]
MHTFRKTITALLTASVVFATAPAIADNDLEHLRNNQDKYITHDAAAQSALKQFPGAQILEVEFDVEHNRNAHYDVELRAADGREYDVTVDAVSGKILSSELD